VSCQVCGAFDPGDDATGYHADDICPDCADEGYVLTFDGRIVNEHDDEREPETADRVASSAEQD
jgi:hypothetical protein